MKCFKLFYLQNFYSSKMASYAIQLSTQKESQRNPCYPAIVYSISMSRVQYWQGVHFDNNLTLCRARMCRNGFKCFEFNILLLLTSQHPTWQVHYCYSHITDEDIKDLRECSISLRLPGKWPELGVTHWQSGCRVCILNVLLGKNAELMKQGIYITILVPHL